MTHLRKRMLEELERRNYSANTIRVYVRAVEDFARYCKRRPDRLGPEHIRQYQAHLFRDRKLAANSVAQRLTGLRFFYFKTLSRSWDLSLTPYPKKPRRLPSILSQREVAQLIDAAESMFHRMILMTLYATGVRRAELTRLQIHDIDSERMAVHVRGGKGRKDRYVMLSEQLLVAAIKEKQRFGNARCGGMNRTEESRRYLFSGILRCGKCSSRMVIVSGRGKRGYAKYGCPSHRYRGICENTLTIRQERLEEQLLGALEQRVLRPEILDYTLRKFREQLRKRLDEIRKQGSARNSTLSDFHRERRELQEKAMRVSNAIAEAGHSPTLLAHLALIESELARVEQRIEAHQPVDLNTTEEEIREFATRNVLHLRTLLRGDVTHARLALMKHVGQLVLMPRQTSTGPMFEVSGAMNLLGEKDVMLMVRIPGQADQHSGMKPITIPG